MLLKQLEYFSAVVEASSFTKAAQRCYISQSAMSQQVKALEEEVGTELLERHGRSFSITPAGEIVLAAARDVAKRLDTMRFELEHLEDNNRHELHVGYLNRYDGWEVPSAIAAFTLRHPQVSVTTVGGSHEDLYELLTTGGIDIAFSDRRRELSDEYMNEHLMTCYTVIEVSEANPLASREHVAVSQLTDTPCILIANGEQRSAERDYYRNVLNFPCPFLFAGSLEEAHMMVAGNRGFLPLETREEKRCSTGTIIKRVPLVNATGQLQRDYYAFWPKARSNWIVTEFARILKGLLVPEGTSNNS